LRGAIVLSIYDWSPLHLFLFCRACFCCCPIVFPRFKLLYGVVAFFYKMERKPISRNLHLGTKRGRQSFTRGPKRGVLCLLGRVHGVASMSGRASFDGGFNLCRRRCPPSMHVGGIRCVGGTTRAPQTCVCL
jgi:hypothetical protein